MVGWYHRLHGHKFEQALGVGDGQRRLVCCSPWGCKESDMTEQLNSDIKVVLVVKSRPVDAGRLRDAGSIPRSRRSPGGGHGNPLRCSCLKNPIDKGSWQATGHRVEKCQTCLKDLAHTNVENR